MKAKQFCKTAIVTVGLLVGLFGCTKKDDRYKDPTWLGGTNIETLQKSGKYTIFLQLMEKAGFKNTISKQLTTLMVPDDDAFKTYFKKKGITSINDLSTDQAFELFTLHYLANPVTANQLVYDKIWGLLESANGEYRSLFFRRKTASYTPFYIEIPKTGVHKGEQLYIYTGIKYVPVFSKYIFQDMNGDPNIDYPYMYPGRKWGGLVQWHSARMLPMIIKNAIPVGVKENSTNIEDVAISTGSGFIYYLDQVVDAMPNIDQYLAARNDMNMTDTSYGIFYDLLQRFASYNKTSLPNSQGKQLYSKHYSISDLASEFFDSNQPNTSSGFLTVFLPNNIVLQNYLNNTVLNPKAYSNLDDVPNIIIQYILQSQITNRLELASRFTKVFFNVYGDKSVLDTAYIKPGFVCSNGVIYKSNRILEPNIFSCVPGPLFFDKSFSTFLSMLTRANLISDLSGDKDVTLFAPTNDQLLAANIRIFVNSSGVEEFQQKGDDGLWIKLSDVDVTTYAQDHVYMGLKSDLSGDGYLEMYSRNFVHYSNNALYGGLNKNRFKNNPATITSKEVRKNGLLYNIDNPIQTKYRMGQYILSDPDLSEFAKLMIQTTLLDTNFVEKVTLYKYPNIALTEGANAFYWTAFIPNNAAMAKAKTDGIIPTDKDSLKSFVNYHFIQKTIFDDGVLSGSYNTLLAGASLQITNIINNLTITDASGQVVPLNHADADNVVRRGVVHKITSVLKIK
jgi:uncharacterized surface protein with fasciclin (FAS1) repeats